MIELPNGQTFVNDQNAIGKWECFDIIKHRKEFDPTKERSSAAGKGFKEIYFLPNGQKYWVFEGWSKGTLFIHYGGNEPVLCYSYKLVEALDNLYMLLEIVEENDTYIEVLIKTSDKQFALNEIGRRENTDIPFVMDERVLGVWKAVDYVEELSSFKGKDKPDEALWLKKIVFYPTGEVMRIYDENEWHDKWSNSVLLDLEKSTVSRYFLKMIGDSEYLFLEWKMGNYVYGGMPPSYYVFKRAE